MTKTLGNILSAIALILLLALCLAFAAVRVLGMQPLIVTGGSMEPNIHKGSLVLVQPVDPRTVKVGDVITFQQYDQTTTHRVTAIGHNSAGLVFSTRGDANVAADPEDKTFPGQVGIARGTLPLAGYLAFSMQAYWRLLLTLIAAITFFGCAGTLVLRRDTGAAPVRAPRVGRRMVLVTVDADEAWNAHVDWVRRTHRQTQVA